MNTTTSEIKNLMHPIKIRKLKVTHIEQLSPVFKKVTFFSEDLKDFITSSPDDHVKAFFPDPDTKNYIVPSLGEKGLEWDTSGPEPIMRDYTPLNYNPTKNTLDFIFFLRHRGPAAQWAQTAQEGSELYIAGPRGSFVVSYVFDWYLFITDESGLPSLSRRLQEMPKNSKGLILAEISSKENSFKVDQAKPTNMTLQWIERGNLAPGHYEAFIKALEDFRPKGKGFVWIKTESLAAMKIKNFIVKQKLTKPDWIKTSGYWKRS